MDSQYVRRLLWHGFFLLLLGLFTGFALKLLQNPRLGIAAHLIGLIDGIFLVALALAWQHFELSDRLKGFLFWSALYGTYMGWASNLLGAVFGTSRMTPVAGAGFQAEPWQENLIMIGLLTVAVTLISMCLVALFGLRSKILRP